MLDSPNPPQYNPERQTGELTMTPGWVQTIALLGPGRFDHVEWAMRIGCRPSDVVQLRRYLFGGYPVATHTHQPRQTR